MPLPSVREVEGIEPDQGISDTPSPPPIVA